MVAPIRIIVGLGNPGLKYHNSRHNAGFQLIDHYAKRQHMSFKAEAKFFSEIARLPFDGEVIFLLKPQTFMNLSGKAVSAILTFYKLHIENVLVLHDELDLPPGANRLKFAGGNAGHNGLKDIDRLLGKQYWRLRIGVGHPGDQAQVSGYVLAQPEFKEIKLIAATFSQACRAIDALVAGDEEHARKELVKPSISDEST